MTSRSASVSTKPSRLRKPLDPLVVASIQEVLKDLGVATTEWDAVIVGDGSGTGWEHSCGWASVLIDHYSSYRVEFYGGWNKGTSHIAEIMPYLEALTWYVAGPGSIKTGTSNTKHIHLITDNANVANCGNRQAERGTYPWLWAPFLHIERMGYILKWHWVARNRLALNKLADYISGLCRVEVGRLRNRIETDLGANMEELLYDYNPTEDHDAKVCGDSVAIDRDRGTDGLSTDGGAESRSSDHRSPRDDPSKGLR